MITFGFHLLELWVYLTKMYSSFCFHHACFRLCTLFVLLFYIIHLYIITCIWWKYSDRFNIYRNKKPVYCSMRFPWHILTNHVLLCSFLSLISNIFSTKHVNSLEPIRYKANEKRQFVFWKREINKFYNEILLTDNVAWSTSVYRLLIKESYLQLIKNICSRDCQSSTETITVYCMVVTYLFVMFKIHP